MSARLAREREQEESARFAREREQEEKATRLTGRLPLMFKPSDILIDAFVARVRADFVRVFAGREQERLDCLVWVARMALTRMTFTNALYTNLTMTLLTTQVATDIL